MSVKFLENELKPQKYVNLNDFFFPFNLHSDVIETDDDESKRQQMRAYLI